MRFVALILVLISSAFLGSVARAESGEAVTNEHRHNPVIYSPHKANPFDEYPKDIIGNVIRRNRSAYSLCDGTNCTLIRNFGHDSTIRREYIDYLIDQRRAKQ